MPGLSTQASKAAQNLVKNRYRDILPCKEYFNMCARIVVLSRMCVCVGGGGVCERDVEGCSGHNGDVV